MSDLCAPIYVIMGGDAEMTFWCFVAVMDRMVNFNERPSSFSLMMTLEAKLPTRSKRDEETTTRIATVTGCHRSPAASPSWSANLKRPRLCRV